MTRQRSGRFLLVVAVAVVPLGSAVADESASAAHWAFQRPVAVHPPVVRDTAWPRGDVDRFVLAALEARDLAPVADADRRTFLRRLAFDLTGLPPDPAIVEAFVADTAPDAVERVVDTLLASPRFGPTWARHWLDVARYAESTGKTVNVAYPHAWRYRDYVIASFAADKPFDRFIVEQIAGDLLETDDPHQRAERLVATGFLAIGPKTLNERSGLKFELDVADEQVDVVTQAFLGLTVACARCHDHTAEPITQADYYALAGIFRSTETCYGTVNFINARRASALIELPAAASPPAGVPPLDGRQRRFLERSLAALREQRRGARDPLQQFFASGQIALVEARLAAYAADGTPRLVAMGVRDKPDGPEPWRRRRGMGPGGFSDDGSRTAGDSVLFVRGEAEQPGQERVPRGVPQAIGGGGFASPAAGSGRRELAAWIASPDNPLAARVVVNRVWQQVFGRGLVPGGDFGRGGQPPSHPELLDHLAVRFMAEGWSVKRLVRSLVTSRSYGLAGTASAAALESDPDCLLGWRMPPRRLEAEMLRDAMLAVAGLLDESPRPGSAVAAAGEGPVARPRAGRDRIAAAIDDPTDVHRSIYLPIVRDVPQESLAIFDAADPALITTERPRTMVASQGLFLMNSPFVIRAADALASRLVTEHPAAERLTAVYVRSFGRPPDEADRRRADRFLAELAARLEADGVPAGEVEWAAWSGLCQALFASAEFQYR